MKKLLSIIAVVVMAGVVCAATGWAGRKVVTFSTAGTVTQTDSSTALKVQSVSLKYAVATNLTVSFYVTAGTVHLLRYSGSVSNATSVVYVPEGLWLKQNDVLTISNSTAAACTALVDLSYD
jgi:hypothetical protein